MAKRKRRTQTPPTPQLAGLPRGVGPGTANDMAVKEPGSIFNGMSDTTSLERENEKAKFRNHLDKWNQDAYGFNPQVGDKVLPLSGLGKGKPFVPQPPPMPSGTGPGTANNMSPDPYRDDPPSYVKPHFTQDVQLPLQGLRDPKLPTGYNHDGSYSYKNPPPLPISQNPYPDSRVLNKPRPPFLVR